MKYAIARAIRYVGLSRSGDLVPYRLYLWALRTYWTMV